MKFLTFCLGNDIADQFIAEIGGLNTQYKQAYIAQYEIVKLDIFFHRMQYKIISRNMNLGRNFKS